MEPDRAAQPGSAPATEEVEISPEMIEAGAAELLEYDGLGAERIVERVFRAMLARAVSLKQ
jgi:hypothetical protein